MEATIKRIAQLMFDNAEYLAAELKRTDNFRTIHFDFCQHKCDKGNAKTNFYFYDDKGGMPSLESEQIEIGRIKEIVFRLNQDVGAIPLSEPTKIREKL